MTTLATDAFNRANGALGATWTNKVTGMNGNLDILSNEVRAPADPCGAFNNTVTWPNDQWAQLTLRTMIGTADNGIGPSARMHATTDNCYFLMGSTADFMLYKVVGGSYISIGSGSACTTGDVLYLEVQGSQVIAKRNTVQIASISDAAHSAGNAGIVGVNDPGDPTGDDWSGGDFAVGGGSTDGWKVLLH